MSEESGQKKMSIMGTFKKAAMVGLTFAFGMFTGHAVIEAMAHTPGWYAFFVAHVGDAIAPAFNLVGEFVIAAASPFGIEHIFLEPPGIS